MNNILTEEGRMKTRAKRYEKYLKDYLKEDCSLLDIGCGDGKLIDEIEKILEIKLNICGVDILRYSPDFKFFLIKGNHLPFKKKKFNFAIFNDVLHHMSYQNKQILIKEALRVSNK